MQTKKYSHSLLAIFLSIIFVSPTAFSQSSDESARLSVQDELIEIRSAEKLKSTETGVMKNETQYSIDVGGWVTSFQRFYYNLDNDRHEDEYVSKIYTQDLRLWFRMAYRDFYLFYVRMRSRYHFRSTSEKYDGPGNDWEQPTLDMGYIKLMFSEFIGKKVECTFGRQYFALGRGIGYRDVHDGIQIETIFEDMILRVFFAKTKPHENNLDYSVPGYDKTLLRRFYGVEYIFQKIKRHVVYLFLLFQSDSSDEDPTQPSQDYDYDSQYFGVGLSGHPTQYVKYWIETIFEKGHASNDMQYTDIVEAKINAYAILAGMKFFISLPTSPMCELEYINASGDDDRERVVTTRNGNRDSADNAFIYFGEYYGGYALSPRITNLSIYKIDMSFKPFENYKFVNTLRVGGKYFFYRKNQPNGAIYDLEAVEGHRDVGQEVDVYLHWKLYHNLYYSFRYGIFFPGKAYNVSKDDKTQFVFNRMTITF